MKSEKQKAALSSVLAAVFLTSMKLVVGIFTGSLGILSEAAHSGLDLVAAVITFFAVKLSEKPADLDHNYGHGKIESFSALVETLLLLATCGWIIYEALQKLIWGKSVEILGSQWGIIIMVISIFVDYTRVGILKKAAKEHGSQALEADALHFSSDVWSSAVVIGGLACVWIGDYFKIPALDYADPVAAFVVSILVIVVSIRLGKRTIDVLLDTAPKGMKDIVLEQINGIDGVLEVDDIRIRPSGANYFIDINVGIGKNESHRVVHSIVHEIRKRIQEKINNSDIVISTFPVDVVGTEDKEIYHTIKRIVERFPICTNIHNIHVYEIEGKKNIAVHIEVKDRITIQDSHELSHMIGKFIEEALQDTNDVSINFECAKEETFLEDVTSQEQTKVDEIRCLLNKAPDKLNCHDIKLYRQGKKMTTFLHCELSANLTVDKTELISKWMTDKIKNSIKNIESVHIHFEPMEEKK